MAVGCQLQAPDFWSLREGCPYGGATALPSLLADWAAWTVSASPGPELSPGTCSLKEMTQTSQGVMLYLRHGYRKGINSKRPNAEIFGFLKQCLFH